jgi:hypothetical protein
MRALLSLSAASVLSLTLTASPASADSRIFIIASQTDGYGIDQCLANGERCGAPMANAYCRQRQFADASAYRRVDTDEITGAVPDGNGPKCTGSGCADYVAITCQR